MMSVFIGWLSAVLFGSSILGTLNNEQLELSNYIYTAALREEIDPKLFLRLALCESKFQKSALGDFQIETDTYLSRGVFQFQKPTFDRFSKLYKFKNAEWMNPYHQTDLAARMIKNGLWYHWENCGKIVKYGEKRTYSLE